MKDYVKSVKHLKEENRCLKQENARLEEKLSVALDGTGLCLWEQHVPSGQLTIFNMEWGKMLGYQSHELSATVDIWKSKLHPDDFKFTVEAFEEHIEGKTDLYQVVHRMLHKDGSDSWVSDRGRVVEFDKDGSPLRMMGTHVDITQEKRYEIQLSKLANSDPLTGLLNRKALIDRFHKHMSEYENSSSALIFIDVDNFKAVNDGLGHKAGDTVLLEVSNWLKEAAADETKIARLGGDEFVLLCRYVERSPIEKLCDNLLSFSSPSLLAAQSKIQIGFSIGVCLFSNHSHQFDDIYEQADSAMYQIKRSGKNDYAIVDIKPIESNMDITTEYV